MSNPNDSSGQLKYDTQTYYILSSSPPTLSMSNY